MKGFLNCATDEEKTEKANIEASEGKLREVKRRTTERISYALRKGGKGKGELGRDIEGSEAMFGNGEGRVVWWVEGFTQGHSRTTAVAHSGKPLGFSGIRPSIGGSQE